MKYFTAKTLDEAINLAVTSLKVSIEELKYEVVEEKRGLFRKTATISVYELADAIEFAQNYIKNVLEAYGLDVTVKSTFRDGVIKLSVNSNIILSICFIANKSISLFVIVFPAPLYSINFLISLIKF